MAEQEKLFMSGRGVTFFPDLDLRTHWAAKLIGAEANNIGEIAKQRHPDRSLNESLDLDLELMLAGLGIIQGGVIFPQLFAELAEVGIRKLTGKRAPRFT